MREIRLFLFFLIGSMLGAWSVLSYAETIPATPVPTYNAHFEYTLGTCSKTTTSDLNQQNAYVVCPFLGATAYDSFGCSVTPSCGGAAGAVTEKVVCPNGGTLSAYQCWGAPPSCPSGQNWTLSGQTCTRPDCQGDQVRGENGVCECPAGKEFADGVCKTACPGGYHRFVPDDGRCEKDCIGNQVQGSDGVCKCNPTSNQVYATTQAGAGGAGCDGGCVTTSFLGTLFCPKSSAPLVAVGALPAGTTCYGYGGRTGAICTPSTPPRVDVTLAPLPPPAPVPDPVTPTPENPNPAQPDPKETADNNKDPVACGNAGGTYYTSNGQGKCGTPTDDNSMEGVKGKVKETITKNPDGSETITTERETETTDPKTGQTTTKKGTTTTTKDAGGNVTGTGTSETTSTKDTKEGEGGGQCAKEPDSPMCRKGVVGGTKGKFESRGEEIEAAKAELKALFTAVSNEAKSLFGDLSGGAGALPCPPSITVLGSEFKICANEYSTQLSIIGTAIYLVCALAAAMLIFA